MIRKLIFLAMFAAMASLCSSPAGAQDWIKAETGTGVTRARVAVPDTASRSLAAQPLAKTFHDVLWSDLQYSGVLDLVSPSFYPLAVPSQPSELKAQDWSNAPANAYMVAYGNLDAEGASLAASGYLSDVHNPTAPLALQKIYRGSATQQDARRLAHQFADDIVTLLAGGQPGIAQTQIAYVHATGSGVHEVKEIWAMDYDGANAHQLTHLGSTSLTPRWSPDATRIAFTCFEQYRAVFGPQICMYSLSLNHLIAMPRFPGTNSSPSWSPDGSKLAFVSSQAGDPEIYIMDSTGGNLRRVTYSRSVNASPVWNPKTGAQLIFNSGAEGAPALYEANLDGSNVQRIDLPDMGYVVDPAWSPNGQVLAFSWRRPTFSYDIYVMDVVSHQLAELTRDSGRNERPSWAPDGRHIVFQSNRTGEWQIWEMLADGSQPRQLTYQGVNESPNWSPR